MIVIYKNELYHHGIEGQKWGVRNGPPYPLDKSASQAITNAKNAGRRTEEAYKRHSEYISSVSNKRTARRGLRGKKLEESLRLRSEIHRGLSEFFTELNDAQTIIDRTGNKSIRNVFNDEEIRSLYDHLSGVQTGIPVNGLNMQELGRRFSSGDTQAIIDLQERYIMMSDALTWSMSELFGGSTSDYHSYVTDTPAVERAYQSYNFGSGLANKIAKSVTELSYNDREEVANRSM